MSVDQETMAWVGAALSGVLAIFFPLAMWRHLRKPESLREAWLYSKPGRIVTACVIALIVLTVCGLLIAVTAQTYPFLWGTFAIFLGSAVAAALYLVRFLSYDPRQAIDDLSEREPDGDSQH